jgi:hypothetical protein
MLRIPELADAQALIGSCGIRECTPITRVISLIAPDDVRSIRVATKIGQRFERADSDPAHGEPVHVYTIARSNVAA